MKLKNIIILLAAAAALVSCEEETADIKGLRCNTQISEYLYGVEYDDYSFDDCKEYFDNKYIPGNAGCSEVRRGEFVGRNLDWYINRNASAIIKVKGNDKRYASIGIVGCFPEFSVDVASTGEYNDVYRYLPFKTEDGVNECGLYVGINVMPTGETSFDPDKWRSHEYGLSAAHTNPSASMHCAVNYLPRILLDNASSVEEAKRIIDEIDWTDPKDYPEQGQTQSFHWLICDAHHSVVLEFIENKAHYTEAEAIDRPGYGTIMTNFTNCLREAGIMQTTGIGYERYDVLFNNYLNTTDYPDSFEGMQKLMQQVWFTKTYTTPVDSRDLWLTEFSSEELPAGLLYQNYEFVQNPEVKAALEQGRSKFYDKSLWYVDETPLWFSTHTSVYNIIDHTLHVIVHEGLDDMKDYYQASLENSHFAKPLKFKPKK